MAKEYVVEVIAPPAGDEGAVAEKLGRSFNLPSTKVAALLRRLPDVVTKPITEREANAVAKRFQQAGLEAVVRPSVPEAAPPAPAAPPPPPGPFESAPGGAGPEAAPAAGAADAAEARARLEAQRAAAAPVPAAPAAPPPAGPPAGSPAEAPSAAPSAPWAPAADPAPAPAQEPAAAAPAATATRVVEPAEGAEASPGKRARRGRRPRRRGSLRAKMVSAAVLPTLLTIAGALAAVWFTARPALYEQLLDSARNPAIATAASLSTTLEEGSQGGGEGIDYLQLQETIQITRQAFARENIAFVVATDTEGNPLSGWFAGGDAFGADTLQLQSAIRDQAIAAVARSGASSRGDSASVQLEGQGRNHIEIVAQPLVAGGSSFGAVVVGVRDDAVNEQVLRILATILLFSLLPLALALLIAYVRSRRVTENVLSLTRKADEISRGDLDEEVAIRSNDELEDLAEALERMRVSMKGAIERLRRRR